MKQELPWPERLTAQARAEAYLEALETHDAQAVALAKQLYRKKTLNLAVVLTPFLATDDRHLLANYFEQYSKQTFQDFTIILFPNASLDLDPDRSAIAASVEEICRLQRLHPHLDVRYIVEEKPDETFVSIGKLRKTLWDAAYLRGVEDNSRKPLFSSSLRDTYTLSEAVAIYRTISPDYFFINHDVDVVHMPKTFMKTFVGTMVYTSMAFPHDKPNVFNCSMAHGRTEDHPQLDAIIAIHDYLYNSIHSGFEAGIAIRSTTYAALGGFQPGSHTYEVAGFAKLDDTSQYFIPAPKITTNPRRMYERLPSVNMYEVWGSVASNDKALFNDSDACRKTTTSDITAARKQEIFKDWMEKEDFSAFMIQAAFRDVLYHRAYDYPKLVRDYRNAMTPWQREEAKQAVHEAVRRALRSRCTIFERLLNLAGIANARGVSESFYWTAEPQVKIFAEDMVAYVEEGE